MVKVNYQFEKRKKEMDKKRTKDQKLRLKQQKKNNPSGGTSTETQDEVIVETTSDVVPVHPPVEPVDKK